MLKHVRKELLLMAGAITTALFGVNDTLDLFGSGPEYDRWAFLIALLLLLGTMIWRSLKLHAQIEDYENKVRVTANISNVWRSSPGPDDDKVELTVGVIWESWSAEDVLVDRLALNLIYGYRKGWWQFWKKGKRPITAIPPDGQSNYYYRMRLRADHMQPGFGFASFEYVADRDSSAEARWLLELVFITAIPKTEHRFPFSIDWVGMDDRLGYGRPGWK